MQSEGLCGDSLSAVYAPSMAIPEPLRSDAVNLIESWFAVFATITGSRAQRFSTRVRGNAITIIETVDITHPGATVPHYQRPVAQLRHIGDDAWSLWWQDSSKRWHDARPGQHGSLVWALAEIESDREDLFVG